MESPLSKEYIHMIDEDIRFQTEVLYQARPGEVSSASSGFDYVCPPTSEGHNFFVRTMIRVFLDFMESPLSQEYIHMPKDDIRRQNKVLY